MCLSAEALTLFLSIITLENVSIDTDVITVHTPDKDVYWVANGEMWCTAANGTGELVMLEDGTIAVI